MIRIIIADDEEDVREGMLECIEWSSNGINVVCTCDNGIDAYAMILELKPDLAILDIRMPGMDGLQVIRRIHEETSLSVAFILLSGYEDFSYAQEGIHLHVDEYLLKPCSPQDILDAVRHSLRKKGIIQQILDDGMDGNFVSRCVNIMMDRPGSISIYYPAEAERSIIHSLRLGDIERIELELEEFFNLIREKNESESDLLNCCLVLYFEIYRTLLETNIVFNLEAFSNITWNENNTVASLKSAFHEITRVAVRLMGSDRLTNTIVARAASFIDEYYMDNLTLDSVAKEVHVSPPYLSRMFKQCLQINFVDYIHTVRINQAKQLLSNTYFRIQDIALDVGYSSDKYFAQVFKRITGRTPSEYRCETAGSVPLHRVKPIE